MDYNLIAGVAIGSASVAGAFSLTRGFERWKRGIAEDAVAEYKRLHPTPVITPQYLADTVAAAIAPSFKAVHARLDLVAANWPVKEPPPLECAQSDTIRGHATDPRSDTPQDFEPFPKTPSASSYGFHKPQAKAKSWKDDKALLELAHDLTGALTTNDRTMKKLDAQARVAAVMEAHARPGVTFTELFPLVIKGSR